MWDSHSVNQLELALSPHEERVGREPERGAARGSNRVFCDAPPLPLRAVVAEPEAGPLLRFAEERECGAASSTDHHRRLVSAPFPFMPVDQNQLSPQNPLVNNRMYIVTLAALFSYPGRSLQPVCFRSFAVRPGEQETWGARCFPIHPTADGATQGRPAADAQRDRGESRGSSRKSPAGLITRPSRRRPMSFH